MGWCLTKQAENNLLKALQTEGDPQKMIDRESEGRLKWFAQYVGEENAKEVNALFEKKLLLKNQQKGIEGFVKGLGGSKQVQREFLDKVNNLERSLSKSEVKQYLADYTSKRLGFDVTDEQFKKITELSNNVKLEATNAKLDEIGKLSPKQFDEFRKNKVNNEARKRYGRAVIELEDYRSQVKQEALKDSLKDFITSPSKIAKGVKGLLTDTSKAANASMDDSALLNQGFPILSNLATIDIWAKNAYKTLEDGARIVGGKEVWNEIRADIVSRPNYINGLYKAQNLAVNVVEDDFPKSVIEQVLDLPQTVAKKVGGENIEQTKAFKFFNAMRLSKLYTATEVAFNGFQLRNRADTFDRFLSFAEWAGKDLSTNSDEIKGMGQLVNDLTSRGSLGKFEPVADLVNGPFFSLRKARATFDRLFLYQNFKQGGFVRGIGILSALQQIAVIASVLAIADHFKPGSVEKDPTSSDYGKIKIGDTRFDTTQGASSYITLAMRAITGNIKSSTSDNITQLNTGKVGSKDKTALFIDFAQNKLSPFFQQLIYLINQRDRSGNAPTVNSVIKGLYTPLGLQNATDVISNPDAANIIATSIADFFGLNNNTYVGSNAKNQYIPENTKISNEGIINTIKIYANALGTDPETAFNRIFTGQKIVRVSNGTVVVQRMTLKDSTAVKKAGGGNNPRMKLDHTVPLEIGGSNDISNLKLVTTSEWQSYSKVENALGAAVKAGKLTGKEAQDVIKKFKFISNSTQRKSAGDQIIQKYK